MQQFLDGFLGSPRTTVVGCLLLVSFLYRVWVDPSFLLDTNKLITDWHSLLELASSITLIGVRAR